MSDLPDPPGRADRERWAAALEERGWGALLILAESARDPDLAHFTGPVHLGDALLVLPRQGPARLGFHTAMEREEAAATGLALLTPAELGIPEGRHRDLPEDEVLAAAAAAALEACAVPRGRVGVAGRGPTGVRHRACQRLGERGWTPVPGDDLARSLRKRKGEAQLAAVRRAAEGAAAALRHVASLLAAAGEGAGAEPGRELVLDGEPLTVGRLRGAVARTLAERGLQQPAGNIVAPGRDAGIPHSAGRDDRVLRTGEALVVDLYPSAPPFADCTRTFCVGEAPPDLAAAHGAVLAALRLARRRAVAGERGWDLQVAVCGELEERGYPTVLSAPDTPRGYVHNLGHGVGYELHEHPSFSRRAGAEGVLEVGDVFTLEPGLYDPDAGWGVRLEDLVALTPGGAEVLTPLPYDLDPRAWATGSGMAGSGAA